MRIRYMSDLHINWSKGYDIAPGVDDKETILIISGDLCELLWNPSLVEEFMGQASSRFKFVLWVLGNHCYWGGSIKEVEDFARRICREFSNITLLDNKTWSPPYEPGKEPEKVIFFGGTLWTSLNNGDFLAEVESSRCMVDYSQIRGFTTEDWKKEFMYTSHMIDRMFDEEKYPVVAGCKKIVITHHAPNEKSIGTAFQDPAYARINYSYVSDLTELMKKRKIDLWFHGHVHEGKDYKIDKTRVLCNPRGYSEESKTSFDPFSGFNPLAQLEV